MLECGIRNVIKIGVKYGQPFFLSAMWYTFYATFSNQKNHYPLRNNNVLHEYNLRKICKKYYSASTIFVIWFKCIELNKYLRW